MKRLASFIMLLFVQGCYSQLPVSLLCEKEYTSYLPDTVKSSALQEKDYYEIYDSFKLRIGSREYWILQPKDEAKNNPLLIINNDGSKVVPIKYTWDIQSILVIGKGSKRIIILMGTAMWNLQYICLLSYENGNLAVLDSVWGEEWQTDEYLSVKYCDNIIKIIGMDPRRYDVNMKTKKYCSLLGLSIQFSCNSQEPELDKIGKPDEPTKPKQQ